MVNETFYTENKVLFMPNVTVELDCFWRYFFTPRCKLKNFQKMTNASETVQNCMYVMKKLALIRDIKF